ncbi:MAG: YaeQ family protein [bacterium]
MALGATLYKVELQVSDMDRQYYDAHSLRLALHPSETEERMMVRLLAFARHAHERLLFTKGLSTDDEPSLWQKSLSGDIELWIELGQVDEGRIRKACARAENVVIYTYNHRSAPVWWDKIKPSVSRFDNLEIHFLPDNASQQLTTLAQRNMDLQCLIQDGQIWLSNEQGSVEICPLAWKSAPDTH